MAKSPRRKLARKRMGVSPHWRLASFVLAGSLIIGACAQRIQAPDADTWATPAHSQEEVAEAVRIHDAMVESVAAVAEECWPEIHCKHFFHGRPRGTMASNDLIIRDGYAMSTNDHTKFADWVAYRLETWMFTDPESKTSRRWAADPWLADEETLEPEDYEDANATLGTDRGHQAPLAAFRATRYWEDTNYLSNITPQMANLNQGPWEKLEVAERVLAEKTGLPIYVITGPLFDGAQPMPDLPKADEPHRLPTGYWKIICLDDPAGAGIECAAFIMEQSAPRASLPMDYLTTIREIEIRSGLNFMSELDDDIEDALEQTNNEDWATAHFAR